MLGVIACVTVLVATVIVCCKMEADIVGITALAGFLLMIGFVLTIIPGCVVDSYYEIKSKSDDVLHKIEWTEKYQDTENGVRDELLYEDIRKINDEIRVGKGRCKNIWYGVFIDDKYLELEEIPMPEWLSPYPNESP